MPNGQLSLPVQSDGKSCLSLPCGFTADGLPVRLQFVGAYYDEQRPIDIAQATHEVHD
jgi:Asp-tRNA(Asn)/Glu-tRNA(Gln) amidotransferase A subunit family amidase